MRAWLRDDPTRIILFRETLPDQRPVKGPTHDQQKLPVSYYRYHGWKDGSVEHQVYRHAQTIAEYFAIARSNKGHHDYPTNASALDNKIIADFLHDAERGFVIWPEFPADSDAVQQSPVHDPESVDFQQFTLSNDSPVDSIQELIFNTTTPPDVQRMDARLDNHSLKIVTTDPLLLYNADEPTSWGQAIRGKDRWLWEAAVRQEIMQLFEIGAFEWTDSRDGKLEGNLSIPSHVVLKLKHEGITAVRSKGRLVADGNFQKNTGEDTFSPTPSMTSFRVLNGYAAKHGRHIETGD